MNLDNPFPDYVRNMYLGDWCCRLCGENGTDCGGLELHHIMGRISGSILNSSLLCKKCHIKMCHGQEEERILFEKTFKWLYNKGYKLDSEDFDFLDKNYKRLFTEDLEIWLRNLPSKNRNQLKAKY